jgi:hypothetical protein
MALVPCQSLPVSPVLDLHGSPIVGAEVRVYAHGTTTPVTVYADEAGTIPLTQPLATTVLGAIPGYLQDHQVVDFSVTVRGVTRAPVEANVVRGDRAEFATVFRASGSGDDTADWEATVQALYDLGGGTIRPLGTDSNPIVLDECDLLPHVYLDGVSWGASVIQQKAGARWALRQTNAEGLPASTTVDDCRVSNVKFDQDGQVGAAFLAEGVKRSSNQNIQVVNAPNSGTWTYDDGSGSGTQTYRAAGIALKGVEGRSGDYYNSLRGFYISTNHPITKPAPVPAYASGTTYGVGDVAYASSNRNVYRSVVAGNIGHDPTTDDGSHWLVVTTTSKFANWQWSASAVYQPGHVAVDTINNRLYVSKTSNNTGHQPSTDDGTNWGLGSWHTATTYAQHDAIMGSDANVYVSQQSGNTGHDPTTDDGTWWKLGAAGVLLTSTTDTAGQKANDNVLQGVAFALPYGVLGIDGWDYHVDGAGSDFSNCFVGVYANGSRVRLSDIYAEICQIGIYLGPLCRDVHIVGKGSFANTVQDLVNLGYRTVWEDRREGRIGYARSRPAVPLPANSNSPQIDGLYAFFTQNTLATNLVGFQADPGNPQISDDGFSTDPPGGVLNGVECLLLVNDSNTTIKDASGNATGTAGSMTAGSLAGNARLTDLNGPFSASDVGKWIQVPGAGRGGGPLTAFIRTYTNATSVVLSNTASVSVSGATYTYGSAFKLAGGRDYKPASGEVLRFFAFQGQFVQIGQVYGQVVLPVETLTDAATVTPNWANSGGKLLTLSQATTIANPTGTPAPFQRYLLRIKSTSSRALTWGSQYRPGTTITLPAATTGGGKTDYLFVAWNADDSKLDLVDWKPGY